MNSRTTCETSYPSRCKSDETGWLILVTLAAEQYAQDNAAEKYAAKKRLAG
jgi:hypothetical protein